MSSPAYSKILVEIAQAAFASGRKPSAITLVAVIKGVKWQVASLLYSQGQRDYGENRIPEALEKKLQAPNDCLWHFVGPLQKNKVRKAIGNFTLIHSVDSVELAIKISECSEEMGIITKILLQANTSGEATKQGLSAEDWKRCFSQVANLKGIAIEGLMTMAPATDDERRIRHCFANLRNLRDELNAMQPPTKQLHHLSMGMSSDFKLAIAEGATIVRIGSALFNSCL